MDFRGIMMMIIRRAGLLSAALSTSQEGREGYIIICTTKP
jgi:hypothetical protein